jgi:AAA domain-containing protein
MRLRGLQRTPDYGHPGGVRGYVLVGGWPASGKTTLARALALELGVAYLSKDQVKEALMDVMGTPSTVAESQRLGRAAVFAVLRAAQGCPAAVIDSTWFPYATGLVDALGGPFVEIRCDIDVALHADATEAGAETGDISTPSALRASFGVTPYRRSAWAR